MQPRRLVLVRHAQAAGAPVDADRELTERGARDAAALGTWLAGTGPAPDQVVVSPARRALQTWDRMAEALADAPPRMADERLYENTPESVLEVVREAAGEVRTLVVVGHNPSLGHLAHVLDDGRDPHGVSAVDEGFPPGTAAVFELGGPFAEVEPGQARPIAIRRPGASQPGDRPLTRG